MSFDHKKIEKKWQQVWEKDNSYAAIDNDKREKFYVLVEFPYPSGDGLHVGHCRSYTALDAVARKARMEGKNVLFPIGFDAFGLPTENYAIKNKIHPREATDKNIAKFTEQLKSIGFSFDWNRVVDTTDPAYYKWTQWIFIQLFKQDLAYQAEIPINWCLSCQIGLANEEVVGGKCERCGGEIERRVKKQWMLKITEYAERLLSDLDTVDYLPRIKTQQQNWIGRSEGADVDFVIGSLTYGELNADFHPQSGESCGDVYLVTWNTVTPYNAKDFNREVDSTDDENDLEAKNFIPGEKIIDSPEKTQAILKALAEAESSAGNDFKILEAVVTENHVHAVIYLSEESAGISKALNLLKGISARRFFESFPNLANAQNPANPTVNQNPTSPTVNQNPTSPTVNQNPTNPIVNQNPTSPTVNGGVIEDRVNSEKNKNDKSRFNHLWRKGYHFSCLSKYTEYEGAMDYVEKHAGKAKVAEFYSKLPVTFRVFTTRPDTLFGATYTVFAPEAELVQRLQSQIKNWQEVEKYIDEAAKKSDLERTELAKDKTGVELKGVKAVNPVNDEEIPIFVADYVLASYGTGAIMAVPAHDKRDHEFAEKFGVEIREVVQPPKGPVPAKAGIEEKCYTGDGVAINSGEFDGLKTPEFKKKIIEFLEEKKAGKQAINYKLRDWIFSRQRYWGEPIPIVHCDTCGAVAVPEKDLPLELPDVKNYEPTDTGESPLASITDWVNVACPKCGEPAKRETDTMPNWAGSSWYFLRYTDPQNSEEFASKEKLKYWTPIDLYNGGMEHTVLHLLYSRFWHKFLYDQKLVPTSEPYAKRISHGMILGPDNEKMSKSRGNVVNPDEIIEKFGADTLRLYEMFIGPFDQAAAWSEGGVEGARRFLDKTERLSEKVRDSLTPQISGGLTLEKSLHKTIKKVSEDLEHFHFNTAISALMIFVNDAQQLPKIPQETFEKFLTILAPFAPHLTEELWSGLGNKKSIHLESWPSFDPALAKDDQIELVIQVNGKLRDTIEVAADIAEAEAIELAKKSKKVQKWIEGKEIRKEIFVPGKLVNLVV